MTNNEAAKWIQLYIDLAKIDPTTGEEAYLNEDNRKTLEAMEMARDALTCNQLATDCISRQPEKRTEKRTETHAYDCAKCNEYDNEEKNCPHYCEVMRSTEDGLQVETYCQKRKLPSAQSDSKESSFTHKALDLIERQAAIDLVGDVCNAVMSGCESWYDPETEDEVYEDIREVDAILKCNKEVRIALRNMPSAQPEIIHCQNCKHWREGDACSYCQKLFNCGVLDVYDYMRAEDDFCSLAERRTDEADYRKE